jgi:hypothetical protein
MITRFARWVDDLVRRRAWIGLMAIAIAFVCGFAALILAIKPSVSVPPPEAVSEQLAELDRLKDSLQRLATFVDKESVQLRHEQQMVALLAKERSELEPIIRSQRQAIEQLFSEQERRSQRNKWKDISLGFAFGILSSLTASVFFEIVRQRLLPNVSTRQK